MSLRDALHREFGDNPKMYLQEVISKLKKVANALGSSNVNYGEQSKMICEAQQSIANLEDSFRKLIASLSQ